MRIAPSRRAHRCSLALQAMPARLQRPDCPSEQCSESLRSTCYGRVASPVIEWPMASMSAAVISLPLFFSTTSLASQSARRMPKERRRSRH